MWLSTFVVHGQNLPSLLTDKNINATFSILAYDEDSQEWGIAVATDNIYVGNSTIYIEPGVGAFSVIAETEPIYGIKGLEMLRNGSSVKEAIEAIKNRDKEVNYRQVSGIDAIGNTFAFTGGSLKFWKGEAAFIRGRNHVVMGNQLANGVLEKMSQTFEGARGTFPERLMMALLAGQEAGGQITGKQSAALVVKGVNNEWFNQIDLRVDHAKKPFKELKRLLDFHYGRIKLNQARFAHQNGNITRATEKMKEAELLLDGWTGMYPRIAGVHAMMDQSDEAVKWINKGLLEDSERKEHLSAFYFLRSHPKLKSEINSDTFTVKDWEAALSMYSNLGREEELIALAKELLKKDISSSYLHFLLGRSYNFEKEQEMAIWHLEKAISFNEENIEAKKLLNAIKGN